MSLPRVGFCPERMAERRCDMLTGGRFPTNRFDSTVGSIFSFLMVAFSPANRCRYPVRGLEDVIDSNRRILTL